MAQSKPIPTSISGSRKPRPEPKRLLDKATFVAAVTAAIATGFAAWYTRPQWVTADISLRASNRAYINSNSLRLVTQGPKVMTATSNGSSPL